MTTESADEGASSARESATPAQRSESASHRRSDGEFVEDETPRKGAALPPQEPFNPEKFREQARAWLAGGLTALLTLVVLSLVAAIVFGHYATKDAVDLLGVLLSPLVALVGAATGFYYGGKSSK